MAGAYCKFCDHRCFVTRIVPAGPQRGWYGHLATCARGKAYDREQTGGYDSSNTVNPITQPRAAALVRQIIETEAKATKFEGSGQTRRAQMYADEAARLDRALAERIARGDEITNPSDGGGTMADDPDAMESMYPRDREDGEGLGLHRPSYSD